MKKLRMKDKKSLYIVLGILMFSMLCAPALAGRYDYDGYSLDTIKNGTVQGDVYVSYGNQAGFYDNLYNSYYRDNGLVTNFTNVPTSGIQWAMLKVGVYGANTSRSGWMNASLSNSNNDIELLEGDKWLNVTPPSNLDSVDIVNASGTGIYLVDYDVKSALENLSDSSITATINTWPDTTWGDDYKLGSRVYGAVLIVVYEGGDTLTQYWINEGNLNLHKNATVWVNGSFETVPDFDANITRFNGPVNDTLNNNFNLTVGYFAGDANQKDYLYFNAPNFTDSPYNLNNPGWDRTKYASKLVGIDVANSSEGKYFDLKTFDVSDLSKSEDNYAIFWRGHESNYPTIWDPAYGTGTNPETESYLSPFLAVLKIQ